METIKENYVFKKAYGKGSKQAGKLLVTYCLKRKKGVRYGVTVSKKIGKAVVRNRTRRRIKESFRYLEPFIEGGADFIFVARGAAAYAPFSKIYAEMKAQLEKGGVLCEEAADYPY